MFVAIDRFLRWLDQSVHAARHFRQDPLARPEPAGEVELLCERGWLDRFLLERERRWEG